MSVLRFIFSAWLLAIQIANGETFRVATYNVENYLDERTANRHEKSEEAKAKVRESILAIKPDVLALQEVGSESALRELQSSLKKEGLDLPFSERVLGYDTNVHVAILSRFPFSALQPHTNDTYLLSGKRFRVSRGFAQATIQVNSSYKFVLITAHLKSKRAVPQADEAEMRVEEARLLREKIDALLQSDAEINLIVLGDLNDTKDSESTKVVIGRARKKLVDTRPAERNGDSGHRATARGSPRNITWTHYYEAQDVYSRIDYILLSPAMAREWIAGQTYILSLPDWGVASDHRPLVATFEAEDK